MKAKGPISVLDFYKWLPPYGENSVSLVFTDTELIVEISYDSEEENSVKRLVITFKQTCSFSISAFPGANLMNIDYEKNSNLSDLVEFTKSEAADKWSKQLPFYDKIKHYTVIFMSENKFLEVFASSFKISEI